MGKKDFGRKGFFIASAIAVILVGVALIVFTMDNSKRITGENREYLLDNTKQMADSIDDALSAGYDNIKILSAMVSSSLTGPEFDISSIQGLIKNSVFDFMEFADKDGMDHNITGGVSDARDRQYYLDAKAGNTGMELIYVSRATHETLLMFYSPIYYEDEFVGSLVGVYQASNRITRLLCSTYFDEPAQGYLATNEGRIIASSSEFDPRNELYVTDLAENRPELIKQFESAVKTGETLSFSLEDNDTGGCMYRLPESGWFVVQIFPQKAGNEMVSEANRLVFGLVSVLILISVAILVLLINFYRNQQRQVENARNQAESANMAKTRFLFNMSHDIRTPLNAIIGFTNIAKKNPDDREKVMDSLEKTQQAGNLLLSLINSILDMSRIESGSAVLDETPGNIEKSLDSIKSTMTELADAKNIDISFEVKDIKNKYVYWDSERLMRILINIITNAIKYTKEGGFVRVICEQTGRNNEGCGIYRYTIEDNGIGISEEFREHVFDQFAREENSTTRGIQGTGLGLSVVKSFVELMNGTVEFDSEQGTGTVFSISLPFRIMNETEERDFLHSVIGSIREKRIEQQTPRNLAGKRVLLVEDNELNREIATDILTEEDMLVEEAEDGSKAVSIMKEKGPDYYDFILMDIQMPVMGGLEATECIRKMYPESKIPIIAISANAFAEDKEASIAAGMNDHVAKPINISELYNVMMKY